MLPRLSRMFVTKSFPERGGPTPFLKSRGTAIQLQQEAKVNSDIPQLTALSSFSLIAK